MTKTLLCLGYGYSARALARQLPADGWRVIGTSREAAAEDGIEMLTWPGDELSLDGVTHILSSIAPNADGDLVLDSLRDKIAAAKDLEWVGYLSTTVVYGDHDGGWVDETTPITPAANRGKWRAQAEADWQSIDGLPLHIFRLAGIYGPGRGPFAKLMTGKARLIIKPGQVFSRIHVEDIAQVLAASIAQPNPGVIYNVCDDVPVPPQDVLSYAAELLGLAMPPEVPFEEAAMTPMARSFYSENKRVSNALIKQELGVKLQYPDYRSGLKAVFEAEDMERFIPPADPPAL
ncbi:SDR family oxidoreductase [Parasedimentitalea psychrophila]|uniref:SDR family oxidoreductase n=1 Tax=Parasedimentitalea psychrophila TaxID=2997337 RepID=A0A9Y2L1C9_9RHOB|nr:SDR family oxidoreductase [Parasedimentitalea psychrophila]WIY26906.1 SDR family oxidoreductase [Parasedimentitalea psychrophila]